jgi:uncharacterized protein YbjQ (UPF0145 family)
MIITTMNDIPGYEIDEVFGEVFGLTVRSRNIGSQMGAGLKSMLGGELKGMTKALVESRQQVQQRMVEEAEAKGANAPSSPCGLTRPRWAGTGPRSAPTERRCVPPSASRP